MQTILVTGAAGFIGGNIVKRLRENKNFKVIGTDKTPNSEQVNYCTDLSNIEHIFYENKIDIVCHQGAFVSVPNSIIDPVKTHKTNVDGFFTVLSLCVKYKVKKVIYASSAAVYNYLDSPYSLSKYINEHYAMMFSNVYKLQVIGLRYFNVYGTGQSSEGGNVIPAFKKCLETGQPLLIYGDGTQQRDFIHVKDVVEANMCAIEKLQNVSQDESVCDIFDIATGTMIDINYLSTLFGDNPVTYVQGRENEKSPPIANVKYAREKLGFDAMINIEEGLAMMK